MYPADRVTPARLTSSWIGTGEASGNDLSCLGSARRSLRHGIRKNQGSVEVYPRARGSEPVVTRLVTHPIGPALSVQQDLSEWSPPRTCDHDRKPYVARLRGSRSIAHSRSYGSDTPLSGRSKPRTTSRKQEVQDVVASPDRCPPTCVFVHGSSVLRLLDRLLCISSTPIL